MTAALEFQNVDILFASGSGGRAAKSVQAALALLDAGAKRSEIAETTGAILGVAGASLRVEPGEISVLMGLSGSGKSTLLRAANGLNAVTRGKVLIRHGGEIIDIAACDALTLRSVRRQRIAMVFQQGALLPWRTVRQNVGFGLELSGIPETERRTIVDEKLKLVGLHEWGDRYVRELSGGMQQRVGLARAFATDADILLMDEPFSALDPLIRAKLQDELLQLQALVKKTILFVSHDLEEALKLGDRITIMQDARIVQSGEGEDIVLRPRTDYVADFVRHMNPLTALTGGAVMRQVQDLTPLEGGYVLDSNGRYVVSVGADGVITRLVLDGADVALSLAAADGFGARVADKDISLQQVVQLRHASSHPVLLTGDGRFAGVCGDAEILAALSGPRVS